MADWGLTMSTQANLYFLIRHRHRSLWLWMVITRVIRNILPGNMEEYWVWAQLYWSQWNKWKLSPQSDCKVVVSFINFILDDDNTHPGTQRCVRFLKKIPETFLNLSKSSWTKKFRFFGLFQIISLSLDVFRSFAQSLPFQFGQFQSIPCFGNISADSKAL